MIRRREFLISSGLAASAAGAWSQSADRAKMDRVAIMSYSFNLIVKSDAHPDDPRRTLDILDFPDIMAQRYHLPHYVVARLQILEGQIPGLHHLIETLRQRDRRDALDCPIIQPHLHRCH